MSEKLIVRQNSRFETWFEATDPRHPESEALQEAHHISELTPYTMLLASLGTCTAIILNKYAQNHGVDLEGVEVRLTYDRKFDEDCEHCEALGEFEEQIEQALELKGDLDADERKKLFHISHHCPIDIMLNQGIEVHSQLASADETSGEAARS